MLHEKNEIPGQVPLQTLEILGPDLSFGCSHFQICPIYRISCISRVLFAMHKKRVNRRMLLLGAASHLPP
jgi:hypothetical protein